MSKISEDMKGAQNLIEQAIRVREAVLLDAMVRDLDQYVEYITNVSGIPFTVEQVQPGINVAKNILLTTAQRLRVKTEGE